MLGERNIRGMLAGTAALLVGGFTAAGGARPQDSSLADQLKNEYKITKVGFDSSGWSVTEPGAVLVIQKGGILGVPPTNLKMAAATYRDGELHSPKASVLLVGPTTKQLTIGEKVYVLKLDVRVKDDKIQIIILECDPCNNATQPSMFKSTVTFEFPKDYLGKADVSQVKDFISQVLAPDANGEATQRAQNTATPATQLPPAAATRATIKLGQSIEQVVKVLGPPETTVDAGAKQIYVYKNLKVTFVDGKVADVQ